MGTARSAPADPGGRRKKLIARLQWLKDYGSNSEGAPDLSLTNQAALWAYSLMGGLDWHALPVVAELVGADDLERLILTLVQIRDFEPE